MMSKKFETYTCGVERRRLFFCVIKCRVEGFMIVEGGQT